VRRTPRGAVGLQQVAQPTPRIATAAVIWVVQITARPGVRRRDLHGSAVIFRPMISFVESAFKTL
jgi:hypothetical protein